MNDQINKNVSFLSKIQGKSTWLKKLQPGEVVDDPNKSVINLKPDAFLVIQESETRHLETLREDLGNEYYISRLVLSKVTPSDAGMYICVVNDHEEGKSTFKYAHLQVEDYGKYIFNSILFTDICLNGSLNIPTVLFLCD